MFEIKGQYNVAKVYAKTVEESALDQIKNLLDQKFSEDSNIAIMPDTHSGAGCVIGFTQTIKGKVVPNLVGCDVGCGMLVCKVSKEFKFDLDKLDEIIHKYIPSGHNIRCAEHEYVKQIDFESFKAPIDIARAKLSLASLGGGNHFAELDIDDNGDHYIVIHSGSRHLGIEVAKYYQNKAIDYHKHKDRSELIKQMKADGRSKEIEAALKELKSEIPDELAYLEGDDFEDYMHDMCIAQKFAEYSRKAMLQEIIDRLEVPKEYILDTFCTIHNYIDFTDMVLRKGAISLKKDEMAIIPMNMRDGSLIVKGKGNVDWNCSGPHGAGRLMSRKEAHAKLSMNEFIETMKDVYTTCVNKSTLDESPMAYKPMDEIVECIKDTCDIVTTIKPIYNFKHAE